MGKNTLDDLMEEHVAKAFKKALKIVNDNCDPKDNVRQESRLVAASNITGLLISLDIDSIESDSNEDEDGIDE